MTTYCYFVGSLFMDPFLGIFSSSDSDHLRGTEGREDGRKRSRQVRKQVLRYIHSVFMIINIDKLIISLHSLLFHILLQDISVPHNFL